LCYDVLAAVIVYLEVFFESKSGFYPFKGEMLEVDFRNL